MKSDTMVTPFFFYNYTDLYTPLPPIYWHIQGNGETGGKQKEDDLLSGDFITVVRQDYFV
jgi:magnesium transporter